VRVGGDKQTFSGRSLELSPSTRNTAELGQRILSKKKEEEEEEKSSFNSILAFPGSSSPSSGGRAPSRATASCRVITGLMRCGSCRTGAAERRGGAGY